MEGRTMHVLTEQLPRRAATLAVLAAITLSMLLLIAALAGRGDGTSAAASRSGDAPMTTAPLSRSTSEFVNPWAAGDAAVSHYLTELNGAPRLPDLDDPVVRRRFVCSFAPASFGIPPPASPAADPYCENADATTLYDELPKFGPLGSRVGVAPAKEHGARLSPRIRW
jgi:hypothetical protein